MQNFRIILAEFMGTFCLVFLSCGAIVVNSLTNNALGHLGICAATGAVVTAMIYAIGNVSGAHMNTAVTVGFLAAGRLKLREVLNYIPAQLAGAIVAALCLRAMFPQAQTLGVTQPGKIISPVGAVFFEAILTFILMFVILNVSTGHYEKGIMAGVAVGSTIMLECLVGGPVTGASMNPARSLGPAVVSGNYANIWIYIAGPLIGASLAFATGILIQGKTAYNKTKN